MRYAEFRDSIVEALRANPRGLNWKDLKAQAHLPYSRPCPEWTKRLERENGLLRQGGAGRAKLWRLDVPDSQ